MRNRLITSPIIYFTVWESVNPAAFDTFLSCTSKDVCVYVFVGLFHPLSIIPFTLLGLILRYLLFQLQMLFCV